MGRAEYRFWLFRHPLTVLILIAFSAIALAGRVDRLIADGSNL
jgi:hypothetical protein